MGGLVAAVATILVLAFGATVQTVTSVVLIVAALMPTVVRATPSLHLWLQKLRFRITNTPATWDVSLRLELPDSLSTQMVADELVRWAAGDARIVASSGGRYVLRLLRRFVIELHSEERGIGTPLAGQGTEFTVSFEPFTIGYRSSLDVLHDELLPVLELIRNQAHPTRMTYSLHVALPGDNPFFGLYVEQMKLQHVEDFRIEVLIPTKPADTRVTVAQDRMTVVAETLESFRAGADAALAFRLPQA